VPSAYELRELDDDELEGRLSEYRRELLNLRFQLATGQLDNVASMSRVRRDVARVLTVMRDREIAAAEGRDAGPVLARPPRRRRAEEIADDDEPGQPRPSRRRAAEPPADLDEAVIDEAPVVDDEAAVDDAAPDETDEEDR
jgi:large subunit ribosomal protein L29